MTICDCCGKWLEPKEVVTVQFQSDDLQKGVSLLNIKKAELCRDCADYGHEILTKKRREINRAVKGKK